MTYPLQGCRGDWCLSSYGRQSNTLAEQNISEVKMYVLTLGVPDLKLSNELGVTLVIVD